MKQNSKVLLIGGLDPTGSAGVLCDLRALGGIGVRASCMVTTLTAQNSNFWLGSQPADAETLRNQWNLIMQEEAPQAIKIGMFHNIDQITTVAELLSDYEGQVILDPVKGPSSGILLWQDGWRERVLRDLAPHVTLLTPNLLEAQLLTTSTSQDLYDLSQMLLECGFSAVLIKGGHLGDEQPSLEGQSAMDLYADKRTQFYLESPRFPKIFRGTGCFLASAIAGFCAQGASLEDAVIYGKSMLRDAMEGSYLRGKKYILNLKHDSLTPEGSRCVAGLKRQLPTIIKAKPPIQSSSGISANGFPSCGSPLGVYLIVNTLEELTMAIEAGIKTIQLRNKTLRGDALNDLIKCAINLARQANCRLFINDYWKQALEMGAYGVHLGQEDLEMADLQAIHQAGLRLGISTHNLEEAIFANQLKPSYMALGPIFETTCKSMAYGPHSIARIAEWQQLFTPTPIVAIGGIKLQHLPEIKSQGVDGVAVISDILGDADPIKKARGWINAWVV